MAEPQYSVKMASSYDSRQKQRAVIEFLCVEKETVVKIHKRWCAVYGDTAVGRSTIGRWVKKVTASGDGESEIHDQPRSAFLRLQDMSFYHQGIHAPPKCWRTALELNGYYVEK